MPISPGKKQPEKLEETKEEKLAKIPSAAGRAMRITQMIEELKEFEIGNNQFQGDGEWMNLEGLESFRNKLDQQAGREQREAMMNDVQE